MWFAAGALYLIAYCHLRRDVRMFAVDLIRSLAVMNHTCQLPLGFDMEAYVRDALTVIRGRQIEVGLRFDRKTSAWTKDGICHPSHKATVGKDGCLSLVLRVADTPELAGWSLGFGPGVRVLRPDPLRQQLLATASQIARQH